MPKHSQDVDVAILNTVIAAANIALASVANRYMMEKDDRLNDRLRHTMNLVVATRASPQSQGRRPPTGATPIPSQTPAKFSSSEGSTGIVNGSSSASMSTPTHIGQLGLHGIPSGSASRNASFTDMSYMSRHSYNEQDETSPLTPKGSTRGGITNEKFKRTCNILSDYTCIFFALIIIFCISRATTMLVISLFDTKQTVSMDGSRRQQDYTVSFATTMFYIVFAVLLNGLFYLSDTGNRKRMWVYRMRMGLSVGLILGVIVVGLTVEALVAKEIALLEYIGSTLDISISLAYILTTLYLPQKLESLGPQTRDTAVKVRNVTFVIAACMLCRAVLLFPQLQDEFNKLFGSYTLSIIMCFEFIPVTVSMRMLHNRQTQNEVASV